MIKVGLVSLGCAKNLIDSEIMIGHLQQAGMVMTPEPDLADVLIVNTCSFIDMAKKESVGAVHDAVDGRAGSKKRARQKIIVAGCLSQRFSQELPGLMPEVDAFIGLDQITQVAPIIQKLVGKEHEQENLVTKPAAVHPRLRHAALPPHAEAHGLHQDRRGLQPPLLLLHHPADPRPPPQPHQSRASSPRPASSSPRA
jgi:tRNA A37 methylthiotransferase MiaB